MHLTTLLEQGAMLLVTKCAFGLPLFRDATASFVDLKIILVLGALLPVTKCAFGLPFSRDGRTPLEEISKRFWCGEERYRSQNALLGYFS